MSSPNPQTPQPPRRSSMQLKRKLEQESGSPAPKRMKCADDPEDSGFLPSEEAPLRLKCSKSTKISSSALKSPSNAGPSSRAGFSNAGPCRCTAKDRQDALIEACNHLAILCEQEDLDWSLLFAMQGLYRPLQRRIQAWEAEPTPNSVLEGRVVFECNRVENSEESN
ncbi:hypothetical protein BT96DRAFT_942316 [Gymnopus androsaceus JB14]|uniref:Uncharacterized protein n=1 Tax=Gymnopus androsaceus JB14 TaxID=1447944 RepID=A0A6A4HCQ8_9AGAR|nr:hypothetical protein BT96DRAFT_942316 [Gymnopus androsaceus JB14]